jgi:hypothetical protein
VRRRGWELQKSEKTPELAKGRGWEGRGWEGRGWGLQKSEKSPELAKGRELDKSPEQRERERERERTRAQSWTRRAIDCPNSVSQESQRQE